MIGTLVNAGAVILGSLIGIAFHARLPQKLTTIAFQGIGLFTLFIGVSMALKSANFLVLVFSIVIGAIVGELLDIEGGLNRFGEFLKAKVRSKNEKFSEGMVAAFLLFCLGSMTVLGALEEGLGSYPRLLLAKAVLDGFASIALASALGIGVIFSVIPLFVYQGGLTLLAGLLRSVFSIAVTNEVSAVGGLLLLGLGINILEIKKLRILNLLPALLVALLLASLFLRS